MVQDRDRKLAELILYVAVASEEDEHFGSTKLNKILFYADFAAYAVTGESITGHVYRKLPYGPVPRELPAVRKRLTKSGSLAIQNRARYLYRQERPVALREPDLSLFSGQEIAIVNEVIRWLWNDSATEVSERSHGFLGWKSARMNEEIPYHTVFLSDDPPTQADFKYARDLIRQEGKRTAPDGKRTAA
ncbi:MAG TPA: Panacea domain-containing protein [Longimicrobium sp.]|jgi:uncharacterized phage-associated protein